MSKKYTRKSEGKYSMDSDRYLMVYDEGEYITKRLLGDGVENVYIYSTLADVVVLSSREDKITVTLQGMFRDEAHYFDVFRLSKDSLYIFATCDAQSIAHSRMIVLLPETTIYNIQIVTNCGEAVVDEAVLARKLKLEIEKGIAPKK